MINSFEPHRSYLRGLAYRMLGSRAEAEDAVQDAWLRWNGADQTSVHNPRAFLAQTVTRLCLDRLKSAQLQREHYIGPWLPEPVVETLEAEDDPALAAERAADVSVAFMLALERLSPLERAAFLLHDIFDCDFAEVAETLQRSPAACRQLATRAREQLRSERPRFRPHADEALASGDPARFKALLAADVRFVSDGGGRIAASRIVVDGLERVSKAWIGFATKHPPPPGSTSERVRINGLPGLVVRGPDGLVIQTIAIECDALRRVTAFYVVRNPDKLRAL
jgi:RNA polymerase sigma-70 factor (ECF subfamily)